MSTATAPATATATARKPHVSVYNVELYAECLTGHVSHGLLLRTLPKSLLPGKDKPWKPYVFKTEGKSGIVIFINRPLDSKKERQPPYISFLVFNKHCNGTNHVDGRECKNGCGIPRVPPPVYSIPPPLIPGTLQYARAIGQPPLPPKPTDAVPQPPLPPKPTDAAPLPTKAPPLHTEEPTKAPPLPTDASVKMLMLQHKMEMLELKYQMELLKLQSAQVEAFPAGAGAEKPTTLTAPKQLPSWGDEATKPKRTTPM